jgi:hypothetical protein
MTRNENKAIDGIGAEMGRRAMIQAVNGAQRYFAAHKLAADSSMLAAAIEKHMRAALPEAMKDMYAALDCGMTQIAGLTFNASMVQAGIAAAKEVTTSETAVQL